MLQSKFESSQAPFAVRCLTQ